jgi:tetratricopeptide (TPR) repeat protein
MLEDRHLTREQLERFAENEGGADQRFVLAHVSGCLPCQLLADEVWWGTASPSGDDTFERIIGLLEEKAQCIEAEKEAAAQVLPHLLEQPPLRRRTLVRNAASYRSHALCQSLIDTVRPAVFEDPHEAVDRARLALEIADGLSPDDTHPLRSLNDLRARAHAELANALRAGNDLVAAEAEFSKAQEARGNGSGDPLLRADIDRQYATLCGARRQFDLARRHIDLAIRWFKRCGDSHQVGHALLTRAWLLSLAGQPAEALDTIEQAISLLEPGREPDVELVAMHSRILYLIEAGQVHQAATDLRRVLPALAKGPRNLRRRVVWLSAKIAREFGRHCESEAALRKLVDDFLAAKLPYSAAVAAVELATVYFEQGRLREVRDLAASVYPVFASLGIDREALASLLLIQRSAEAETLTLELLQRLARQADEAESRPPAPAPYERSAVKIFRT